MMGAHNVNHICLIVSTVVAFVVTCFFNAIAASDVGVRWGVFYNTTGAIAEKLHTEFTPAGWTFGFIWGVIYVWQALFLAYSISTIFRKGLNDGFLYYDPDLIPGIVFLLYVINMGLNITWLLLWDRQHLIPSLAVLALMPFTLFIMLFFSCRAVAKNGLDLTNAGMKKEIWLVRILVHNAFGIYATWTSIATLLNLAIMLTYFPGISLKQEVASSISIGLLMIEVMLYFFLDLLLLDRYLRYMFTPYFVIPVALIGNLAKNWNDHSRNSIMTAVLLAIALIFLVVKLAMMTWRSFRKPIFCKEETKSKDIKTVEETKATDINAEEVRI